MIVIDASVGLKLLQNEEYTEKADELLVTHRLGTNPIIVPQLFFLECANALSTKSHTNAETIKLDLQKIIEAKFIEEEPRKKDIVEASLLAKRFHTTVYDMLYAVIAKKLKVPLITADANFLKKTHFPFVKLISEI